MLEQFIPYLPMIVAGVVVMVLLIFLVLSRIKLAQQQMMLEQLHQQLTEKDLHVEAIKIELAQQTNSVVNFQTQTNLARQEVAKLHAENQGLLTRISERDEQLLVAKQQHQESAVQLHRMQGIQLELSNELTELKTNLSAKQDQFEQQKKDIEEQKVQLKMEFSNLANQILEEKGKSFSLSNKSELDAILRPFKEQVEGFQKRVNEVHSESVKGQASLASELKKVLDVGVQMSDEANNLATALKGEKKTAGNWGEIQLERTLQLAGLVKGDHYDSQEKFVDAEGQRRLPDFVIKLPDNKHIVIDSKVSLVAYDRAISAKTEAETQHALDEHVGAVKNHIDDLTKKDYANLIGMRSPSFVLMFMPIEPAYIEALKHNKDMFTYGYERNVVLVSHTTLMPILKTVANLWRIEQGNQEAREISERAGEIYNQVCLVADRLQKLGRTLDTVGRQYNETVKGLAGKQGLAGKVERFSRLSNKVSKSMPKIEPSHIDVEHERLDLIAEAVPSADFSSALAPKEETQTEHSASVTVSADDETVPAK